MSGKILVGCKRVIDYAAKVRVKQDNLGVMTEGVKHSMNPFDEIAMEEAIRLKEKKIVSNIIAFSCGSQACTETLKTAFAMGADRGILVETNTPARPLEIAHMMAWLARKEEVDLVMLGKQSIDGDNGQVAPLLASILNWGHALYVSKLEKEGDSLKIVREIDGGQEMLSMKMPAVLSVDLRLNVPRFVTLPNIMKAKKKTVEIMKPQDLGVELPQPTDEKYLEPPQRQGGWRAKNVDELLVKLKEVGAI